MKISKDRCKSIKRGGEDRESGKIREHMCSNDRYASVFSGKVHLKDNSKYQTQQVTIAKYNTYLVSVSVCPTLLVAISIVI